MGNKPNKILTFTCLALCFTGFVVGGINLFKNCRHANNPDIEKINDLAAKSVTFGHNIPSLKVTNVCLPDSLFGDYWLNDSELGLIYNLQNEVLKTIRLKTDDYKNLDNTDEYVIGLSNMQLKCSQNLMDYIVAPTDTVTFSGWKVKLFYEQVTSSGDTLHAMRYCFMTPDASTIVKIFDIPLP